MEHLALKKEVHARLMDGQSPEAVAGRITRHEHHLPSLSKDAIYRYIKSPYGRRIEAYRMGRRRRRSERRAPSARLSDRIFIDQRPRNINARKRIGDTEADFIVSGKSGKGILLVVVDRKSRTVCIEQIVRVTIPQVHRAFLRIQQRFPEMRTITTDNDILFAHHEELARLLRIIIYFCRPYHSWEKGTVEHANGVIRNDVSKGSDISQYTKRYLRKIEDKLNRRPMKCLRYRTPEEVLARYRVSMQKQKTPR